MTKQRIHRSSYPPPYIPTNLSVSQFLARYNPDAVPQDKIILEDDWTAREITYSCLRKEAARQAWALQQSFGLRPGDVVAISAPNSVCLSCFSLYPGADANQVEGCSCSTATCCSLGWWNNLVSSTSSTCTLTILIRRSLINHLSTEDDFAHCFKISKPSLVVVDASLCETITKALHSTQLGDGVKILTLGGSRKGLANVICSPLVHVYFADKF